MDCNDVHVPYCTFKVLLDGADEGAYATITNMEGQFENGAEVTLPESVSIDVYGWDSTGTFRGGKVRHHVDCNDVSVPYCTLTFEWVGFPSSWPVKTQITGYGDVPDGGSVTLPASVSIDIYGWVGPYRTGKYRQHVDCTWSTWTWRFSAGHN